MSSAGTQTATQDLPAFPQPRTCPLDIAPGYRKLLETEPIAKVRMPTGEAVWLVTKWEYARQLLVDPRISADRMHPGYPVLIGFPDRATMQLTATGSLLGMDAPEHTTHRRILVSEFTVRRVRELRPRIQQIVDNCVDNLLAAGKPADLHEVFSLEIPSRVVCELIGIPVQKRDFFKGCTQVMLNRNSPGPLKKATSDKMMAFYQDLIMAKEKEPADDIVSRLVDRYRKSGNYDRRMIMGLVALMVTGGHETTANMISLSTIALLENPGQLARLREDWSRMPDAVEELLRFFSVASEFTGYRGALEDIEIGGVTIRAGDGVITLGSAANWDPEVFERPGELDIERGARHHTAFGFGPHQCIGQNLARTEIDIAVTTLFSRIPDLQVAVPVEDLPFKHDVGVYGVHHLPVTW
ncbi:MAG TPA: cytochrome P450 [Streptosporangiaceae bacterium]